MTTIVTPIQDELALAQAAYDTALQNLMKASAEFNDGAGNAFTKALFTKGFDDPGDISLVGGL